MIELKLNVDPDEVLTLQSIRDWADAAEGLGIDPKKPLKVTHHVAGRDMAGDKKGSDWCTVTAELRVNRS